MSHTDTSDDSHRQRDTLCLTMLPLLPACTSLISAGVLVLAVTGTLLVVDVGQRMWPAQLDAAQRRLPALLLAATVAGLAALLLRAVWPAMYTHVGMTLPLLVLVGVARSLPSAGALRPTQVVPALVVLPAFAILHAAISGSWRSQLALVGVGDAPVGVSTTHLASPAAALIGLALLMSLARLRWPPAPDGGPRR